MPTSCPSCGTPLSTTDPDCPACGSHPGGRSAPSGGRAPAGTGPPDGPPPRVPGRLATGTVIRGGAIRQEPIMSRNYVWASRIGAVFTAAALAVAVLAHAAIGPLLLVLGAAAVLLPLLGAGLRASLPAAARDVGNASWPWVLPLRDRARSRSVDVCELVLKDVTGAEHVCAVTGRLTPAPPEQGTAVDAYGRRDRAGRVAVRQLVVVGTGEVLRPRLAASGRFTLVVAAAAAVAWFATAIALLVLAAG